MHSLAATQAFSAVEALVTSSVADSDVAAAWTSGCIQLEMGDGGAEARHDGRTAVAVGIRAAVVAPLRCEQLRVAAGREISHGAIQFFFHLRLEIGHGEFGLGAIWIGGFAITGD